MMHKKSQQDHIFGGMIFSTLLHNPYQRILDTELNNIVIELKTHEDI